MRWTGFSLLVFAYVLVFFHRMAPAVVAGDLQADLGVDATRLGILAASYYYIYTLLQPISGLAADRLGPHLAVGVLGFVGGLGSIVFGLAENFTTASIGRLMVGGGVAFVFVGLMKYNSLWFTPGVYGRVSGLTLLIGNLGAVAAAGPLAFALGLASWRAIFVGLGITGILLSIAVLCLVRLPPADTVDHPEPRRILRLPGIRWGALVMFGTVGNVFAFAGLWSLPLLQERFALERGAATAHVTALMLALAAGALSAGWVSDRLGRRKPLVILGSGQLLLVFLLLALAPWQPGWSGGVLFVLLGLAAGWVSVVFANAKELAGMRSAGFAIGLVNTGLFLGAAVMQSLFGWILDAVQGAPAVVHSDAAWSAALLFCAAGALIGLLAALRMTDSGPQLMAAFPAASSPPLTP